MQIKYIFTECCTPSHRRGGLYPTDIIKILNIIIVIIISRTIADARGH